MKKLILILLLIMIPLIMFAQIEGEDLLEELEFWDLNLDLDYEDNILFLSDYDSENYNDIVFKLQSTLNALMYYFDVMNININYIDMDIIYIWDNSYNYYSSGIKEVEYQIIFDSERLIYYLLTKDRRKRQDIIRRELRPIYDELKRDFNNYQNQQIKNAIRELKR